MVVQEQMQFWFLLVFIFGFFLIAGLLVTSRHLVRGRPVEPAADTIEA